MAVSDWLSTRGGSRERSFTQLIPVPKIWLLENIEEPNSDWGGANDTVARGRMMGAACLMGVCGTWTLAGLKGVELCAREPS